MKANDIKKIAGQEWGHYRIFGKTIVENGQIVQATSPLKFYKDSTLVSTFAPSIPLVLEENDYWLNSSGKHYIAETETTEQANSVLLPKDITKVVDANGLELEFEILNDSSNFSNKIVQGKNAPTITAEKVITKGFTSGGEHFTHLYIYDDGEVWYVDGQSSAQAFVQGIGWELEYKQLQFDSGVKLTTSERNALLNIYDLI